LPSHLWGGKTASSIQALAKNTVAGFLKAISPLLRQTLC